MTERVTNTCSLSFRLPPLLPRLVSGTSRANIIIIIIITVLYPNFIDMNNITDTLRRSDLFFLVTYRTPIYKKLAGNLRENYNNGT